LARPNDLPPGGAEAARLIAGLRLARPFQRTAQRIFGPAAFRVWSFSLLLAVTGAAIILAGFRGITPLPEPLRIPWPVIALGFYLAEINVVEVHFRRETHAFTLSEVPTVLGLFLLSPFEYLAALILGSALALRFHLRQPTIRLVLNLAYYLLIGALSVVIFHGIGEFSGAPTPRDWIATFATTLTTCVLGALVIATAISLSGGAPQYEKLPEMLRFAGGVALANTSIALLAVTLLWREPWALWLLGLPVLAIFVAYRAYVSEREKGQRLELLYESSRILQRTPELDSALVALLEHTREMFRAERAEIILYPSAQEETALRTSCGLGQETAAMIPVEIRADDPVHRRVAADGRAFRHQPPVPEAENGVRELMACPLAGESRLIGAMVVTNRIAEGTNFGDDDLRLLETIGNQVATALENGQLEQSLAELSRLKEQLRHQAYHDPLTNLANRALFAEQVIATLERREPGGVPVVLFLDLDDFKLVNDTQGHATGDRLLVAVAERIIACVRGEDVAARLGGDEFGILMIDRSGLDDAITVAGRLLDALAAPFLIQGRELLVGVSIGIAAARPSGERADELLRNADVAMYTAKATGKHRFAVFEPTMHAALVARHELSSELSRSVARGELEVFYQPIVDLRTGSVMGVEALTRWRHPARGFIPPDEFIRLAEDSGAILALGRWVLHTAATQIVQWQEEFGRQLTVSVNLSPSELQQAGFIAEVDAILDQTRLDPHGLVLEMTETAMFQDAQTTISKLELLRGRGVRIAVDDFGTGYSSLGYLRRFPVDILKIARDFMANEDGSKSSLLTDLAAPADGALATRSADPADPWAFAHAIVALGQTLGLRIVAEGIETAAQWETLRSLGCDLGQGYLFLAPVDAKAFGAYLRTQWPQPVPAISAPAAQAVSSGRTPGAAPAS
jgi:diguanylate cyclase (GGDEF)-like protein